MTPNCDPAVEAVVVELERVAIHDTGLDIESLLAHTHPEQLEHDRRLVRRQYLRAEARRRDTEGTAASRHVQEPHTRTEPGTAEAFVSQPHLRGSVGLVIAWRDFVPRRPRIFSFLSGHSFLLKNAEFRLANRITSPASAAGTELPATHD
jgi:hypothetical protein